MINKALFLKFKQKIPFSTFESYSIYEDTKHTQL